MTRRRQPHRQPRGRRATLPTQPLGPDWPPCGNHLWEHAPDLCVCWHDRKECPGIPEVHWAYTCPYGRGATVTDPVAFLEVELGRVEELARAAGGCEIEAVDYLWGTKYLNLRQPNGEVKHTGEFSAELADHVALNSPAAVLRRVKAGRAMLGEHASDAGDCRVCAGPLDSSDDSEGNREWSRSPEPFPCRTVRLLAEAWGWEETT